MSEYYLRSDKGVLICKLTAHDAGFAMNQGRGKWVEKNFESGRKTVFVFEEDFVYTVGNRIQIFGWVGYYLTSK